MDCIAFIKDNVTKFDLICVALLALIVLNLIWTVLRRMVKHPAMVNVESINKRQLWIDALKTVSAFMVVLIHVSGSLYNNSFASNSRVWFVMCVINAIPRFAVPCFLMITGAFSLGKDKSYDFQTVRKKVIHILVPLVFWSVIYIAARKALWNQGNVIEELLKIPFEFKDGALWYGYQLIWLYLGMPLWQMLWDKSTYKLRRYFVLFTLGIPGVLTMAGELSLLGVNEYLPFATIRPELCYVGMLFLGRILYEAIATTDKRKLIKISLLSTIAGFVSMIAGSVYLSANTNASAHNFFSEVRISGVLYGVGIFLAFGIMKEYIAKLPRIISMAVTALSKVSLGVYLSHCLMIWLLNNTVIAGIYFSSDAGVTQVFLCAVMCYVAAAAMCILMRRLPVLRKLVE